MSSRPVFCGHGYDPIIREILPQYFAQPSFPPSVDSHPIKFSHVQKRPWPIPPTYPTPRCASWAEVALSLKTSKPLRGVPHWRPCPMVVRQLRWAERHQECGWQFCLLSKKPLSKEHLSRQESDSPCQAGNNLVSSPTGWQIKHTQTRFLYNYIILEKTENNTWHSIKKPWFCWLFCVLCSIRDRKRGRLLQSPGLTLSLMAQAAFFPPQR